MMVSVKQYPSFRGKFFLRKWMIVSVKQYPSFRGKFFLRIWVYRKVKFASIGRRNRPKEYPSVKYPTKKYKTGTITNKQYPAFEGDMTSDIRYETLRILIYCFLREVR